MHNHDDKGMKAMTWMMVLCCLVPIVVLLVVAKVSSSWWVVLGLVALIAVYLLSKPKKEECKHCILQKQAATKK